MPLHILLILVIGGICGIALALHLLGLSRVAPFNTTSARHAWLRAYPDDVVHSVEVTEDGRVARVRSERGQGVVWQMGMDSCARLLDGSETLRLNGSKTVLSLGDYAAPKVRLTLSEVERETWRNWIAGA